MRRVDTRMDVINHGLLWLDSLLGSAPWFPFVLLGVGVFFTLYLGFPQIRYFSHAWRVVRGRYENQRMAVVPMEPNSFAAVRATRAPR